MWHRSRTGGGSALPTGTPPRRAVPRPPASPLSRSTPARHPQALAALASLWMHSVSPGAECRKEVPSGSLRGGLRAACSAAARCPRRRPDAPRRTHRAQFLCQKRIAGIVQTEGGANAMSTTAILQVGQARSARPISTLVRPERVDRRPERAWSNRVVIGLESRLDTRTSAGSTLHRVGTDTRTW